MTFLYNFLNCIIYIKPLHLFTIKLNKVYKLMKIFYRLKQITDIRYKTLVKIFTKLKFI